MNELKPLSQLNDRQLIGQFVQSRDERAFAVLVSRHAPMVLRVCRRIMKNEHDAEDVFQAVFMLVARKSRHVRWHACVANWLYGVAVRIARQEKRRLAKHRAQELVDANSVESAADAGAESSEIEGVLYQELDGLPNKYRAPVVLCHLEGKSRRQAADELGLNETTVKGRLERAREMLRWKLHRRELVLPAAVFSGELARQIADAAISESMTTLTAQLATKFASGNVLAGASANAAAALAKGELGTMFIAAQVKWAILTVTACGALGTGAILFSPHTKGEKSTSNEAVPEATAERTADPPGNSSRTAIVALIDDVPQNGPKEQETEPLNGGAVIDGLKMLGLAMHNSHGANGEFPAAATYDANGKKLLSWRVHILPYLDQRDLYSQFHLREAWDSEHNKSLIEKMPKLLAAGSDTLQKAGKTIFLAPIGRDTAIGSREPIRIQDITDGTSNTIMILTVKPKHAVEWTRPDDWEFDEKKPFDKLTGEQGKGFRFCLCDGSALNLGKVLTPDQLKALLTRNGGDVFRP